MPGPFYFAYCDEDTPFDGAMLVYDEMIFNYSIDHAEGSFPSLEIEIVNPYIGLMSVGRKRWCWFSWDNGTEIKRLFHGQLVGHATGFAAEAIKLQFTARPSNYNEAKLALAETLKSLPYYDPVFIDADASVDATLSARTQLFHTDRLDLSITVSDIAIGEDGDIEVSNHFYDSLQTGLGPGPLRRVHMQATGNYTQRATGELDLTAELVQAAQQAGSPTVYPIISSLTGDGMFKSWPKPEGDIGEGWKMSINSSITAMDWITPPIQAYAYNKPVYKDVTVLPEEHAKGTRVYQTGKGWVYHPAQTTQGKILSGFDTYILLAPLDMYLVKFVLSYDVERKRSEVITFTLEADAQEIVVDPGDTQEKTISISTDKIDQPVDAGGALPIGDARLNSYFVTDRGLRSLEYLILLCRAELVFSARAVPITFQIPWFDGVDLSCRKNAILHDPRLPGGVCSGKIIDYKISGGEGNWFCEVQFGCMIGYGNILTQTDGVGDYAAPGYMATGYQHETGGNTLIGDTGSEVTYAGMDDLTVIDDDGADLLNVTAGNFLVSLTCDNAPEQQRVKIYQALGMIDDPGLATGPAGQVTILYGDVGDASQFEPSTTLTNNPTKFRIELKPMQNASFVTNFSPELSMLTIPKTIDLEAAP